MDELFIGLMSGTSADGIDAVLVDFTHETPTLIDTCYTPYSDEIRNKIIALCTPSENEINRLGELDHELGMHFADAVQALLQQTKIPANKIKAIGSHGQTIRHHPHPPTPYTLQIGDPNIISAKTRITTIADFRRKDIAYGGQGAPLVPAFHHAYFNHPGKNRVILNIGGIANITLLPQAKNKEILGFDTGPGNILIDSWISEHYPVRYDKQGAWAKSGKICPELLAHMLQDPYFHRNPPKSTGREHFHLHWLKQILSAHSTTIAPVDIQTTLTELTARSIMQSIMPYFTDGEIMVCGGGVHNEYLQLRLVALAGEAFNIVSTEVYGIHPDWIEAMAFAWLAKQTLYRQSGNLPHVTGAREATLLGGVYFS